MGQERNNSRINNKDNYADRPPMKGEQEYLGEDVGQFGQGKGAERKRLLNEIDDNAFDAETVVEVIDDPKYWGEELQIHFVETNKENYEKNLVKYIKIVKKTYKWLKEAETGKKITSLVSLRATIGMSKVVWDTAEENSEEFMYYSTLIRELIGARLHELGIHKAGNQVFKIFSLKNHLPDEFADKKETTNTQKIEVLEIKQGTKKEIEESIKESKDRLKKG